MSLETIEGTRLWQRTLAKGGQEDPAAAARERLRAGFLRFRERAALIVAEIHRELPELTVHDISHLDALWEMADIVVGQNDFLNPAEGFVFGGAVLLHDAGMALAAYPGGVAELMKDSLWADNVAREFQQLNGRNPNKNEIEDPPEAIRLRVLASCLRALHAKRAEQLPNITWTASGSGAPQYLIEDTEIRQSFGRIIGLVAHSHWWPIHRLESEFVRPLGSPYWCPREWQVDSLKVACLLRVADAAHLDARRAPTLLRALRKPSSSSDEHWKFQERLQKPYLADDALAFSSGLAFRLSDAPAWWLCLESLSTVDKELRNVDRLLADKHLPRLAAKRVAGIESPERLLHYVPTDGWSPVDAFVHVSDVPRLVRTLGGKELYGNDRTIALRELIQNGADAVRARRMAERRAVDWGMITVRTGRDAIGDWLEVEDSGVGMSKQVLVRYLLDFGASYWGSTLMLEEFPGLLSQGFQPTGKYGIGFFSVFMLGSAVRVRTRQASAAHHETQVLEFNTGLSTKPILRPAAENERIRDGGTSVRVWADRPLAEGLFHRFGGKPPYTLLELCRELCPSIDVSLSVESDNTVELAVAANDWLNCDAETVIMKGGGVGEGRDFSVSAKASVIKRATLLIRELRESDGTVVGRACITDMNSFMWGDEHRHPELAGVVTVGGLSASNLAGIAGILVGKPERAARDVATPIVTRNTLKTWASDQARLIAEVIESPQIQIGCAEVVWRCGGDTGILPICRYRGQWLSRQALAALEDLPDELFLVSSFMIRDYLKLPGFELHPSVIQAEITGIMTIVRTRGHTNWPEKLVHSEQPDSRWYGNLGSAVVQAVAQAWRVDAAKLLAAIQDHSTAVRMIGHIAGSDVEDDVTVIRRANG